MPDLAVKPEVLVLRDAVGVVGIEDDVRPVAAIQRHAGLVDEVAARRNGVNGFGIHLRNWQLVRPLVRGLPGQAVVVRAGIADVDVVDALLFAQGVGAPDKGEVQRAI